MASHPEPVARDIAPALPPGPITGPSAWRGADLRSTQAWVYTLSADEIAEIESALVAVRERDVATLRHEDFPLPGLGPKLRTIRAEILTGRGFVLIHGLPVASMEPDAAAIAYWGIGLHLGKAVSQNGKGHLLGHVRDLGYDVDDPNVRVYQTSRRQNFHTDSCDIVGLLCLRKAKRGGLSSLVSSVTVYNEMLARDPALTRVMFKPFRVDRRGEIPAGMKPYFTTPVFNWNAGYLTTYYVRRYIESAQRLADVPPLSDQQIAALDLFDQMAEDAGNRLDMDFEPGDMQFLHNHQILHDRTDYEDWPEPERKRHLLRLWLCPPEGRPLPPCYAERWGSIEIGDRGGIVTPDATLHIPLSPI